MRSLFQAKQGVSVATLARYKHGVASLVVLLSACQFHAASHSAVGGSFQHNRLYGSEVNNPDTLPPYTLIFDDIPRQEVLSREYGRLLTEQLSQLPSNSCPSPYKCSRGTEGGYFSTHFMPPYPTIDYRGLADLFIGSGRLRTAFVPIDEAHDGRRRFAHWRTIAGGPAECSKTLTFVCAKIVWGRRESGGTARDSTLLLCAARAEGPTRECIVLAVWADDNRIWINVVVDQLHRCAGLRHICYHPVWNIQGMIRVEIRLPRMAIRRSSTVSTDDVQGYLQQALRGDPLLLRTNASRNFIRASAPPRISAVLDPYREEITLFVQINDHERTSHLDMTLVLLVNRQNTDRDQDWHRPSQAQRARYGSAIEDVVRSAFSAACPDGRSSDDFTWVCR